MLVALAVLMFLILLLRLPFIQTLIVGKITKVLSNKIESNLTIEGVNFNFIDHVSLYGIYLEDQAGDTLLYADEFKLDLAFFKLLKKEINLEEIYLNQSSIRIQQLADSSFNFSFILDAFATEDTSATPFPFDIQVGLIEIMHADYSFNLLQASNHLQFGSLIVEANEMDVNTLSFDLKRLELDLANVSSIWKESNYQSTIVPSEDSSSFSFPLSGLPISISSEKVALSRTNIYYQKGEKQPTDTFNANAIILEDVNIFIDSLNLSEEILTFKLRDSRLCLNKTKALNNFNLDAHLGPQELKLFSESWSFNKSFFDFQIEASYSSFNDLVLLDPTTLLNVDLNNVEVFFGDVLYFLPELDTIDILHNLLNETIGLDLHAHGTSALAELDSFNLNLRNSSFRLKAQIQNAIKFDQILIDNLELKASAQLEDLRLILGKELILQDYNRFGTLEVDAQISGNLDRLHLALFKLNTNADLKANFTGFVEQLDDFNLLSYDLDIEELSSSYNDARAFTSSLPELLKSFSFVSYQGHLAGDIKRFDLDGLLKTSLGNADANVLMDFNDDYSNASYNGQLELVNFQLGRLLDNDSLGVLSLQVDLSGEGLSLETIAADLDLKVSEFSFNSYIYQDLLLQGSIDQKSFEGDINIDDENIALDFQGMLNLQDSLPEFNFNLELKHLNTQALNLSSFPLSVSLNINSELKGKTLDDLNGNLLVSQIQLTNDEKTWEADSLVFSAKNGSGANREIQLRSSILNLDLEGNYNIANLPLMFLEYGDQHFPFSLLLGEESANDSLMDNTTQKIGNEYIKLEATVRELPLLASFFNIELKRLDSASLSLNLDPTNDILDFKFYIPSIDYQNIHVDSVYMFANTSNGNLNAKFSIDSASYGELAYIPGLAFQADFKDQLAYLRTTIENDTGSYSLDLNAELYSEKEAIGIRLLQPFMLNTRLWDLAQTGSLIIADSGLVLPQVQLSNGKQKLVFSSSQNTYNLNFSEFDLNNLLELVEIDSFIAKGRLNGFLKISNEAKATAYEADLALNKFAINSSEIGDVKIDASLLGNSVESFLTLKGEENSMNAKLTYDIQQTNLSGQVVIDKLYLPSFEPLIQNYASNLKGFISGDFIISGKTDAPEFNGQVNFNGVKAFVKNAGTLYGIESGSIFFSEKVVQPNLTFVDEGNRKASLTGSIEHKLFSDLKFKMNFDSDAFTFLNSAKTTEAFFFGKFIASTHLTINGNMDLPKIRGKLITLPESDITVQLLSEKAIATQETYVIFLNGADFSLEEIDSIANERYQLSTAIDLSLLIDINDKTILNLVIDPITGDNLSVQGNGQLSIKIPPKGDLDITGVYTVTSGQYNFSFQKLLKRKFELVKGSQIVFAGNPLNASLDLKAAYYTEASTYALVESQAASLSQEEERDVKKKQEVSVELNIKGKLAEPVLSFDINLLNGGESPLGSSAKRALDQLKQNETELNKQVFSLLLFNSFSGSSSSGNISSTGSSTAVRSVGNLISTQLNRLASKAEGLQIDFDLDQYQDQLSESNEQITQIDLGLSQSLLDDRLLISVGGNVDLESGGQSKSALGSLAGDFVIEYKLSNDGKYKVRVFQKSDFDALNNANLWKTGAGFSYQSKFGKLKKKKGASDEE